MTATLETAADALRDTLTSISGVSVFDVPPESMHPPAIMVIPPEIDYQRTFSASGLHRATLELVVLTAPAGTYTDSAIRLLWPFADAAGSSSVYALINADQTLGGVVEGAMCKSFRLLTNEEVSGYGCVGGSFQVDLHWRAA